MHEGFFSTLDATSGTTEAAGPGQELRFVEPVAHAWLQPEPSRRQRADAMSVLDEFGVTPAQSLQPPVLPENPVCELTIEEVSRPTTAHARTCFCWSSESVAPDRGHPATQAGSRAVLR